MIREIIDSFLYRKFGNEAFVWVVDIVLSWRIDCGSVHGERARLFVLLGPLKLNTKLVTLLM